MVLDLRSGDKGREDAGIATIREWISQGHVADALWKNWVPQLLRIKRYEAVVEFSLTGSAAKPQAIAPLMSMRAKALLAMDKPAEALVAAKSYYNVCEIKATADAVDLVASCLAKAHPEDAGIAARFKDEQAGASVTASTSAGSGAEGNAATTQPAGAMLKGITVDPQPFEKAIETWHGRGKFGDRVSYGDVLLAADKCTEAEGIFKELYATASTQQDLATATEGLARTLRAEDGNLARANAWLLSLQQADAGK